MSQTVEQMVQALDTKITSIGNYVENLHTIFSSGQIVNADWATMKAELQGWTTTQLGNVPTLAGNNSFTGSNTFTGYQYITGSVASALYFKDTDWAYGEAFAANNDGGHWSPHIYWYDKNNNSIGGIVFIESNNAHYMTFRMFPKNNDLSKNSTTIGANLGYNKVNNYNFFEIPTINFSKNPLGTIAVNINALNDLSNSVVHKTGEETISGVKKYTSAIREYNSMYIINNNLDSTNISSVNAFTLREIIFCSKEYDKTVGRIRNSYHGELSDPTTNTILYALNPTNESQVSSFAVTITNSGSAKAVIHELVEINGDVIPIGTITNNVSLFNLGSNTNRWNNIYNSSGIITGSDERIKQNIESIPEKVLKAWGKVNFKQFKFKNAVKEKGDNARTHIGVIAQSIISAFISEGLTESDVRKYGLLCHDEWEDVYEDVIVKSEPAVIEEYEEIIPAVYDTEFDETGKEVKILVQEEQKIKKERVIKEAVEEIEHKLVVPAGDLYSVRYEECLALECAYQRWRLDQIEAKLK